MVGAILHVLYAEADKTLAGVASFLSDPKHPIETTLRAMLTTTHLGKAGPHPVIASAARELLNKSENERSGVLSTAMSLVRPATNLQQRVIGIALRVSRIEQDDAAEAGAPTGGQAVVLTLDVVDDD